MKESTLFQKPSSMRCLSLWQPWATLMRIGAKKIETRSWGTSYRGEVAIQASKRWSTDLAELCLTPYFRERLSPPSTLPRGVIVGVCTIVDCVPITADFQVSDEERAFGDYTPGRFAWLTIDMRPLKVLLAYSASQGLFTLDDATAAQVRELAA